MKNVCFFNTTSFWGGGEKLHLDHALKFKEKGYNVFVVTSKGSPLDNRCAEAGINVLHANAGDLSFLNPFKYSSLIRFYKREQIDTVVFSSSQDLKLGGISAKRAGVKTIAYLRGLAVVIKGSAINKYLFKSVLTHIIANSEETKRTILKNLHTVIPEEKIRVVYHGIDLKDFDDKATGRLAAVPRKEGKIILGNLGRLTKQKGQKYLIELAKKLKEKGVDFELFIAGDGDLKDELQQLIDQNNLNNEVTLLGFVRETEQFIQSIDIFLLSSIWEGFGFVIVEAMAGKKPVVCFDITSNPEIIADGKTGYLVDYPNIDQFSDKVIELIKDEKLRKNFGEKGRERAENLFEINDRITEFEQQLL